MASDLAPFAGTVGGWFLIGFVTGYAIKKVIKLAAVIFGLIIAAIGIFEGIEAEIAKKWLNLNACL